MDRRSQILRAAARRIARDGVRGLRVTDVADEAGVSPGLLYYHFTDRSGLLGATLDYINDHAIEVRGRSGNGDTSPYDELEAQLLAELDDDQEVRANSAAWNELRALAVFETDLQEPMRRTTAAWNDEVARSVKAAQSRPGGADDALTPISGERRGLLAVCLVQPCTSSGSLAVNIRVPGPLLPPTTSRGACKALDARLASSGRG